MLGALVGIKQIPYNMVQKILKFDCVDTPIGQQRPEFLSTRRHLMVNIKKLIEIRPKEKLVIQAAKIPKNMIEKKDG